MSTPSITGWIPKVSAEPTPAEIHRNLTLIFQKLANHASAFGIQQDKINSLKSGTVTKVIEGGSGGGSGPSSSTGIVVNNQSGVTSYATASGDNGALIILSDASPIAVSLTGQAPPFGCFICNQGAGTATLTPSLFGSMTPTISYAGNPGAASMPLLGGYGTLIGFDGTSWWALTMPIVPVSFGVISHEFLNSYDDSTGLFTAAQPAFTDISGTASIAQIGTGTPASGDYVDGGSGAWTALPNPMLSGTSSSMGGSPLLAGQTITVNVTVTGATTSMVATCSPETYPGDGTNWDAYVSAADTVTVRLTAVIALTPTASVYNVRVLV